MSEFEIEQGIEIPVAGYAGKYPFREMLVGDSFSVKRELVSTVRAAAYNYAKINNVKFVTRKEGAGFRVWRTV